jgi:hypothetical protein
LDSFCSTVKQSVSFFFAFLAAGSDLAGFLFGFAFLAGGSEEEISE